MDQVTTYTYNVDDSLASTGFTNETIATPDISHTYDTYYPRAADDGRRQRHDDLQLRRAGHEWRAAAGERRWAASATTRSTTPTTSSAAC